MTLDRTDCGSQPTTSDSLTVPDAMFRRLVECADQGIGWADLNGNVVYMNPALRRMLDLAPEAAVSGLNLRRFRPPEAAEIAGEMLRVVREQGSWSGEVPLLSEQSRVIPTRHDIQLLRDATGTPMAIGCSITDLSTQKHLEQSLRNSKSKYRALVENIPQRVFYKDRQLRYLAVNRHCANDKGVSPQNVVGQDDYAFSPRGLADKYRLDDQRIMASGQAEEYDESHEQAGKKFTAHTIKTPVRDEDGQVIGICGIYWDVTEQRRLEERLQESEATLRAIYENVQEGMLVAAEESGRMLMANPAMSRMLGYSERELLAMTPLDLHPPEAQPRVLAHFQAMQQGDFSLVQELPFRRQDGVVIYMDVSSARITIQGKTCFLGGFRDVTERRQVLAQLRDERNFSGAVLENAGALVVVLDREGRIRRFNRACEILSQYDSSEVEGRCVWDFLLLPAERDTVREQAFLAMAENPATLTGTNINRWLDRAGDLHLIDWHNTLLLDAQGCMEYMVCIGVDVTEQREMEAALQRSQETYARAEAIAHIGSWDWDIVNGTLRWSDEIYRIFGLTPQMFGATYQAFLEAIHPDDRQGVIDAVNASVTDASVPYSIEHRVLRPDGEVRSVFERGKVYRDENGTPLRMIGSVQDITERKQAERRMRETVQLLDSVVENIPNMIFMKRVDDLSFVLFNKAGEDLLGYRRDELLGKNDYDFFPREQAEFFTRKDRATLQRGFEVIPEEAIDTRHNGRRILQTRKIVLRDEQGMARYLLGISSDITERKRAEQELERHRMHLEDLVRVRTAEVGREGRRNAMIVNTAMDGFFSASLDGRMLDSNEVYARMLGYTKEELLRLRILDIEAVETPEEIAARMQALIEYGHDRFDTCHRRKDGKFINVEVNVTVAQIGAERCLFAFVHDITDRKEGESALICARDEAERANCAKSEFLSRMSHELRTPLNAILGFGQLLERAKLAGVQADNVQEVIHAGRHLLELINEVLDLARIESGKFTLSLEAVALLPLVADCVSLMRPQADNWGIELIEAAQGCGEQVRADRTRLKQVLLNLLSNAVKYNRKQGKVSIACVADGETIQIRISDTGAGLNCEQQARLFVPFERLDADMTAIEGTGIGLALSKRLVELMGGTIGVESVPGVGSTFWVRLPTATGEVEASGRGRASDAGLVEQSAGQRVFNVLCIEDNPANLRLVERILSSRPAIRLLSTSAPNLGLELAQAHAPALILLDINLPDLDGYEVLRRLQADVATRAIPVVGISANAMPKDIERARAAGFAAYLTKPLDISRFLAVVDKNLDCLSEPESP